MTSPDTIQGVELPTYDDQPAIPDDLRVIWYALMSRAMPRFSNVAARDLAYPVPVDGQVCFTGSGDSLVRWVGLGGAWVQELTALQLQVRPLYQLEFLKAANFTVTVSSAVAVAMPALDVGFDAVAGHRYRITTAFHTQSSAVSDVTKLQVYTKIGAAAAVETGVFNRPSNSSPTQALTSLDQTFYTFLDAGASGVCLVTHQISRPAGTGTITAQAVAAEKKLGTVLVEDMGTIS